MQNITRKLTVYKITAYDVKVENMQPTMEIVAECEVLDSSMTRGKARAALAEATGMTMPKGIDIIWEEARQVTYAMPLDQFLAGAVIVA